MNKAAQIQEMLSKIVKTESNESFDDSEIKYFTEADLGEGANESTYVAPKFVVRKGKKVMLSPERRRNLERLAKAPDKPGFLKRFSKTLNKVVYTRITAKMKTARRKLNLKLSKGQAARARAKSMAISRRLKG
jgi:hypothetical protein